MLKSIFIKIKADNSITATYPYKIYQGEINKNKFVIDPSLIINDLTNVVGYIGFKRSDNQKSGLVPLEKQPDGTFTYVIKDYWTLNLADKVWFTLKFIRTDENNTSIEYQLYSGNSSFVVNPVADYLIGDDVPPDQATVLQNNIDQKLNKDFTSYPTYGGTSQPEIDMNDRIVLNRESAGSILQYNAKLKDVYRRDADSIVARANDYTDTQISILRGGSSLSIREVEDDIDNKIRTVSSEPSDLKVGQYIFLIKEE